MRKEETNADIHKLNKIKALTILELYATQTQEIIH